MFESFEASSQDLQVEGCPPRTVRFREPRWHSLVNACFVAAGFAAGQLWLDGSDGDPFGEVSFGLTFLVPIGYFARRVLWGAQSIDLEPMSIHMTRSRMNCVPWSEIQGVTVEPRDFWHPRRVQIIVRGFLQTLRTPTSRILLPDPDFDEKAETVAAWWLACRGPDWVPTADCPNPNGLVRHDLNGVRNEWRPPPPSGRRWTETDAQ